MDAVGLGWGLRICISHKLAAGACAVAHTLKTTALEPLVLRPGCFLDDLGSFINKYEGRGPPSEILMELAWDGAQVVQMYSWGWLLPLSVIF